MIFVTGDCHGDYRKLSSAAFREQKEMDRQDFVIVCGDFGYWDRSRRGVLDGLAGSEGFYAAVCGRQP